MQYDYFVGVDYHKHYSVATVLNREGDKLAQERLDNTIEAFSAFLKPFPNSRAAVEATRGWAVGVECLERAAAAVALADPAKTKIISVQRFKSDGVDSYSIAELLRIDWLPEAYLRNRINRDHQLTLRMRCFFVRLRTQVKNRIHDLIDRQSETIRRGSGQFSDLFGKKGLIWLQGLKLESPCQQLLTMLLSVYQELTTQVSASDALVKGLYERIPECQLVGSIPGFGPFFSVLTVIEIGDIVRFPSAGHLCSYAGVVPRTASSGGKVWHGRIIKESNRWLRWALVEAAIPAANSDEELAEIYGFYRKKKGSKTARVVLGRRLGGIVYYVLRDKRPYRRQLVRSQREAG